MSLVFNTELEGIRAVVSNHKVLNYRYSENTPNKIPKYINAGHGIYYKIGKDGYFKAEPLYKKVKDLTKGTFKMIVDKGYTRKTVTIGAKT